MRDLGTLDTNSDTPKSQASVGHLALVNQKTLAVNQEKYVTDTRTKSDQCSSNNKISNVQMYCAVSTKQKSRVNCEDCRVQRTVKTAEYRG